MSVSFESPPSWYDILCAFDCNACSIESASFFLLNTSAPCFTANPFSSSHSLSLVFLHNVSSQTPEGHEEKQFKIEKIPLHTVRQYYTREIKLADMVDVNNTEIDVKTQVSRE